MFSGNRSCLRTTVHYRLLPGVLLLNQPLLFLYPRWFAIRQYHGLTSELAATSPASTEISFTTAVPVWGRGRGTNSVEPFRYPHVPQQPSQNPSKASPNTYRSTQSTNDSIAVEKLRAILKKRRARQGLVVSQPYPDGLYHRAYLAAPGSTSSKTPNAKKGRNHTSAFSERSQWEQTLMMLANSFPQPKEAEGDEIWLSKLTLTAMSGTSGANSWVYHAPRGCEVEVTEMQSSSGMSRKVIIRGSPQDVALTREHFRLLERDLMKHQQEKSRTGGRIRPYKAATSTESDSSETTLISGSNLPLRRVLIRDKRQLQHADWMRADELPRPAVYDVRSFMHYVEHLTTTRVPRLVKRDIYGLRGDTHNIVVARILCRLFTDTNTARFASTAALNLAFAFLCKHTELFNQTSQLYDQCQHLNLTLQPQTYSYVLRVMLTQNEIQGFRRVLHDLHSEGYRPDSKIWLALLERGSSLKQKYTIANWMCRKDLLGDSRVKGQVAAQIFNAELKMMEHDRGRTGLLLASIDARFGRDWMSQGSVAQALKACADNKAWSLSIQLLKQAQERGVTLDSAGISAVLTVMQRQGSLRDSLDLLRSHYVKTTGRNDHLLIPKIFMTAWRHRFYNVCRVLWRYAAVQGCITYKMQNVVTSSLLRNQDICTISQVGEGLTMATAEWRRRAGKVIVGTNLNSNGFHGFFDLIGRTSDSTSANPMVCLAKYTPDGEPRDQQSSLAYVMLYRDLEAWKHFAPPSSERLFMLLSDAYAMDVQWKSEGIGLERGRKSLQWMIENAIAVPLVKREIMFQARSDHQEM